LSNLVFFATAVLTLHDTPDYRSAAAAAGADAFVRKADFGRDLRPIITRCVARRPLAGLDGERASA